MMIIVNRLGDNITGAVNGKQFGISFDAAKYDLMKALEAKANAVTTMEEMKNLIAEFEPLTKESYKELVETACPYIHVNKHTNKYYLKYKDVISTKPMPVEFVEKILLSVEKNIDIMPIVLCWTRFLREIPGRPSYTSERAAAFADYITAPFLNKDMVYDLQTKQGLSPEAATALATTNQVAITQEGLIVCYKVSREISTKFVLDEEEEVVTKSRYTKSVDPDTGMVTYDTPEFVEERLFEPYVMGDRGDAFRSGSKLGHHIRVGESHWLENWSQVGVPGQKGLHCGGLSYIAGFQNEGTVTHNIFVDPADIHSISIYGARGIGNDGAMTVKRYFVHSSFAGVNKNIYHSSKYAALQDEEFQKILEEVTKQKAQLKADLDTEVDEQTSLA